MQQHHLKQPETSRPLSAVSNATGMVGLLGLLLTVAALTATELSIGERVLACLAGTALPMLLWAVFVEKTYQGPDTGLDLSHPRPFGLVFAETVTKLIGLWSTFLIIACLYWLASLFSTGTTTFFVIAAWAFPFVFVISIPYVFVVNRYMQEPHDGLWHMGKWVVGQWHLVDRDILKDYLRGWTIKAFFLVFMFSILQGPVSHITSGSLEEIFSGTVAFVAWCTQLMFLADVCFGTIGYILTLRLLDSHIRSANPYLSAWVAALICYPPFLMMGVNGPLNYRHNTQEWMIWLQGHDSILMIWGALLILLTVLYAWATIIFGIRFSNLTHRGIITNGPYRYFKHPAYLSKNIYWWLLHMPFLSLAGTLDALHNCLLLLAVNAIYYARAKTEEKHLMADENYRQYSAWIAQHGLLQRLVRKIRD